MGSNVSSKSVPFKYVPSRDSIVYSNYNVRYAPPSQISTVGVNSEVLPKAPLNSNLTTPNTMSPITSSVGGGTNSTINVSKNSCARTPIQHSRVALKYTPAHYLDVNKRVIQPSTSKTQNISSPKLFPSTPNTIDTNAEFSRRRDIISREIKTRLNTSNKKVVIAKKGLFGKIKLGFKSLGTDLSSIYIKYDSITRRKLL